MMQTNKGSKGQMEILGLVVIVLLISVGMLFMVSISLKGSDSKKKVTFENKFLSSNMVNVILRITTECGGADMSKVIIDMYDKNNLCVNYGYESNDDYVLDTIQEIFSNTLDKWGKEYQLVIYKGDSTKVNITNYEPGRVYNVEASLYPLPTSSGDNVVIRLDILDR